MLAHCLKYYHLYLFATFLVVLASTCTARELSIYEFDALVKDRKYLFIFFYSESCEECSKVLFTWELLRKRILSFTDSKLAVGQVNCDIHKELCSRERVSQVPSIKLYTALDGITQLEFIYDLVDTDLASLETFLRQKLPNSVIDGESAATNADLEQVTQSDARFKLVNKDKVIHWILKGFYELTDEDFSVFLGAKGENLVYFYTPWCQACHKLAPQWENLIKSLELRGTRLSRINCAQNPYACKFYLVEDVPTLIWVSNGRVKRRHKNLMSDFIAQVTQLVHAIEHVQDADKLEINLNNEDFWQFINSGYHFVHFTVPWSKHCEQMAAEWLMMLEHVSELNVKICKVDCSVNEVLCDIEQVDSFPTLYLYKNGKRLGEYEGSRTASSLVQYLRQFATKHDEL